MIKYKLDSSVLYTDTDSIFTTKKLPLEYLGKELGMMKDELEGGVIDKAYFYGIKQYGYTCKGEDKSVFAGVPRNSITFAEIEALGKGEILTKHVDARFYKSLVNLNVTIKPAKISIKVNCKKELVNNNYSPIHINGDGSVWNFTKFIIKKISHFLSKWKE